MNHAFTVTPHCTVRAANQRKLLKGVSRAVCRDLLEPFNCCETQLAENHDVQLAHAMPCWRPRIADVAIRGRQSSLGWVVASLRCCVWVHTPRCDTAVLNSLPESQLPTHEAPVLLNASLRGRGWLKGKLARADQVVPVCKGWYRLIWYRDISPAGGYIPFHCGKHPLQDQGPPP